jgi:hypothetical protein
MDHLPLSAASRDNTVMDAMFQPPVIDRVEAMTSAFSALVYIVVAILALMKDARDARVRLFFVLALTGLVPYLTPVLFWREGDGAQFTKPLVLALALSVTFGGIALFHFLQIFPWRRRWIRDHLRWLGAAYIVCPLLAGALIAAGPDRLDDMTPTFALTVFAVGLPLLVLVGIVLPFAGLLSIYNSWLTAKRLQLAAAERPALAILVSQLAGGVLAIVIVPLLHFVLPSGPWTSVASMLLFGFGLLMPLAFADAIWHHNVLAIEPGLLTEAQSQ